MNAQNPIPELPYPCKQRIALNDEVHQHPYEPLLPPQRVICIGMRVTPEQRAREAAHLQQLFDHFGQQIEWTGSRIRHDFGRFRLKIELHQEFTRYKFVFALNNNDLTTPFAGNPLRLLPKSWLTGIPGEMLIAMDIPLLPCPGNSTPNTLIDSYGDNFNRQTLIGSLVGRSGGVALTDFIIRDDGLLRMLVFSRSQLPSKNGRLILRLIEIETYRMLAMHVVPDARKLLQQLPDSDARLTELTDAIARGNGKDDEQLLEDLTALAAHIENLTASSYRRLSASRAYFNMVSQRLNELNEQPIDSLPSLRGILNRRLEPARMTCDSVSHWLEQLSQRVSQASQLLRTRIDVGQEKQTQALLQAMNEQFQLQLRLQSAAEILSVAIFTYYAVSLLSYIGEETAILLSMHYQPLLFKAIAVPLVACTAVLFVLRLRKRRISG